MRWAVAAALALASCTTPQPSSQPAPQPALLPAFEAELAAQDSATAALGQWCARRALANPATIRAIAVAAERRTASADVRTRLGVGPDEPLAYRHVRLACGNTVLSDAQNWYVPSRLTPAMNRLLETTDRPFGTVVAPLGFRRERGAAQRGAAPDCPADTILSHSAVLRLPDGRAISAVSECYTPENLR